MNSASVVERCQDGDGQGADRCWSLGRQWAQLQAGVAASRAVRVAFSITSPVRPGLWSGLDSDHADHDRS